MWTGPKGGQTINSKGGFREAANKEFDHSVLAELD